VIDLFGKTFAKPTGLKHGTVTVVTDAKPPRHVEVTTFRGEGAYLDGRRPSSVTYVKSLSDDLGRRDFTMNAVAYDPIADVVTDLFDGRGDLSRGLIRAVGDPVTRLSRGRPAADARRAPGRAARFDIDGRPRLRSSRRSTCSARFRRSGSGTSCSRCWRRPSRPRPDS
jgi:tRNA nucleotidyltransferase (CCA-adding enzyme)